MICNCDAPFASFDRAGVLELVCTACGNKRTLTQLDDLPINPEGL